MRNGNKATAGRYSLRGEAGFAIPTVIAVMTVGLAFASVASVAAVNSLRGTNRDEDSKRALAAADAGVSAALVRQNTIAGTGSSSCLEPGTGGMLVGSSPEVDGWCAPVTGAIDSATYSYRTVANPDGTMQVVSTGSSDDATRRVMVDASSASGSNVFADATVIGRDWIHMDSNARVHADVGTNGSVTLDSNAKLCGAASVGVGQGVYTSSNARHGGSGCAQSSYPVVQSPLSLAPVQQGDVATNNSNGRFFSQDLIGGNANKVEWSASARELVLKSNVSLTLGGSNYSFCRLELNSNSSLYIAAGATVRIFFDSPEACGYGNGVKQFEMKSNSRMRATSGNATHVSLLFVGSDVIDTEIELHSNSQPNEDCSSEFVIYAPKMSIEMDSNVTYCGAIAGKSLDLDSNSQIVSGGEITNFELPGAGPHYVADRFVECTAAAGTVPSEGC